MTESSIVRENLMTQKEYTPYCGNMLPSRGIAGCNNPRTYWSVEKQQFYCNSCGWTSQFPSDFIERYKLKWNK